MRKTLPDGRPVSVAGSGESSIRTGQAPAPDTGIRDGGEVNRLRRNHFGLEQLGCIELIRGAWDMRPRDRGPPSPENRIHLAGAEVLLQRQLQLAHA